MKKFTVIKTAFVLAVVFLSMNVAVASGKIKVNLDENNSESAIVEISDTKMSKIEIEVKDSFGEVLYSKKTTASINNFKSKFNFSQLEDGLYRFSVKIDNEQTEDKFSVIKGDVELLDSRKSVDPYFAFEKDKLDITFLNYQEEAVSMFVYDNQRNLLYEKNLGTDFAINHGVDFSKLRYGNYEIVLANEQDIFEYNVMVK